MRILHLSDLHYGKKYKDKISRMYPSFLEITEKINITKKIDFVVFTGDLVWSGIKKEYFYEVENEFIIPLMKKINIDKTNFILCSGNHDMSGVDEYQSIKEYIDKFDDNDNLNKFIDNYDAQFDMSYEKSLPYYSYIKEFYKNDYIEKLYQIFNRKVKNRQVGFVSFHTPWRSFKGNHSGKLLIPTKIIQESYNKVKNSNLLISLMHHPFKDLKEFNCKEVEDLIYEKFHVNLSGHYHDKRQGVIFANDIGMLSVSAMSTMSGKEDGTIGFSVIDIDVDTYDIDIINYSYIDKDNVFVKTSEFEHKLPMSSVKSEQVKLLKKFREYYDNVLHESNLLLVNNTEIDNYNFIEQFQDPIVKEKSYYASSNKDNGLKCVGLNSLYSIDSIIYGKDKFGKTSLLRSIQLNVIDNFLSLQIIPVYLDFNKYILCNSISLYEELNRIFHMPRKKINEFISDKKFLFLIDNFDGNSKSHIDIFKILVNDVKHYNVIITSRETRDCHSFNTFFNNKNHDKFFIHPVTRKDIRSHTYKVLTECDSHVQQEVIDKIILIFNQMNIPFNYWYLSLFLWIYKKEKNFNINDNVEMLILYIDKLLERENLAKLNKDIDYELFKKLIGELAHVLITKYIENDYSISYLELIEFISKYKDRHIRFVTDVEKIVEYLLEKGILKKNDANGRYSFRLNGVMEYFIAIYMFNNDEYVDIILHDKKYYLSFANEIEIFSGLKRNNLSLLKNIFNITNNVFLDLNNKFNINPDIFISDEKTHSKLISEIISSLEVSNKQPIGYEQQDRIYDDAKPVQSFNEDVKVKNPVIKDGEFTIGQLERHLFILSRSFRSLTLIEDKDMIDVTFEFIITSYINLGFKLLEELLEKSEIEYEKNIVKLISNFIPFITQYMISESILHKNLSRYIEDKILEYEIKMNDNQYKLMILYFMMLDLDLVVNYKYIDRLTKNISIKSLKNIVILKLLFYLMMKSSSNVFIENYLKTRIVEMQTTINPKIDKSKSVSNLTKELMARKLDDNMQ